MTHSLLPALGVVGVISVLIVVGAQCYHRFVEDADTRGGGD